MIKTTKTKNGNVRINLDIEKFQIIHSVMKQYEFFSFDYPEASQIYKSLERFRRENKIDE